MPIEDLHIDKTWTLFLDRDGVINHRIAGDYVRKIEQFRWIKNSAEAIAGLSHIFGRVLVVTNQQGVGKNLMKFSTLEHIHDSIREEILFLGGKIDKIYYDTSLAKENSKMRKPNVGMGKKAKIDFPEIDFEKSIICGDSASDMIFGHNLGMKKVFIQTEETKPNVDINIDDYKVSLWDLYQSFKK